MIQPILVFKKEALKVDRWDVHNGKRILKTKRKILTLKIMEDYDTIQPISGVLGKAFHCTQIYSMYALPR